MGKGAIRAVPTRGRSARCNAHVGTLRFAYRPWVTTLLDSNPVRCLHTEAAKLVLDAPAISPICRRSSVSIPPSTNFTIVVADVRDGEHGRRVGMGGVISEAFMLTPDSFFAPDGFAPEGAPSFALLAALPVLLVLYVRYLVVARRLHPDLALRKLESIELQRTMLLYERAYHRLEDIHRKCGHDHRAWRARSPDRDELHRQFRAELEDLESYARDLRSTITRLRGRPFKRYKRWAHLVSARFAISRSLWCYALILALLLAALCYLQPILWAPGLDLSFKSFVLWQAVKGQMLFGNSITATVAAVATPFMYFVRRATLYREHRLQVLELKAFAITDPDRLIQDHRDEAASLGEEPEKPRGLEDRDWRAVLGVAATATIEDVKQAYKTLVKKNHPDRVQDMSPAFIRLADVEMKKLNAAYAEALAYFQQPATAPAATATASATTAA
jgi:hypothetical protein